MSYIYNINEFVNGIVLWEFQNEIKTNNIITKQLQYVEKRGDDIYINFDIELDTNEENELNLLVNNHNPIITPDTGLIFDTIVDASGKGNYLLPSDAFEAGHKHVFIRKGLYLENKTVNIPNGGSISGESGPNTIIHFSNNNFSIKCGPDIIRKETIGTITINNNSDVVYGNNTLFSNLLPEDYILIGTNYVMIDNIISDTELKLVNIYKGSNIINSSYVAQNMYTGISIKNVIVTSSQSCGIMVKSCRHISFDSIYLKNNSTSLCINDSGDASFNRIILESSKINSMIIDNTSSLSLNTIDIHNNDSNGIDIINNSKCISIHSCEASNNKLNGLYIDNSKEIYIVNSIFNTNDINGLEVGVNCSDVTINNSSFSKNNNNGIILHNTNNILSNNLINNNNNKGIICHNINNSVNNCLFKNNNDGFEINGNENIISNNIFQNNSNIGIFVNSDNCIISNNIIKSSNIGISIPSTKTDNIICYNNFNNNTDIIDNGFNNDKIGNK